MSTITPSQMAGIRPFWPALAAMISTGVVAQDEAMNLLQEHSEFAVWFQEQGGTVPPAPFVKPPELLIQTSLYDALNDARGKNLTGEQLAEHVARYVAGYLAFNAHIDAVLKMVAAVGGPGELSQCRAMVQAVLDRQEEA